MEDKRVVVVGAGQQPGGSTGNGHAIASLMGREGAEVCCVDVVGSRAADTADEIASAGGRSHALVADVSDPVGCAQLVAEAVSHMGGIDVLVNNVGVTGGDGHPLTLDEDGWQRIMDVNLRSMWLTCKAVWPIMQDQRPAPSRTSPRRVHAWAPGSCSPTGSPRPGWTP